jgi:hypothetical protein
MNATARSTKYGDPRRSEFAAPGPAIDRRLESWKEIAAYLNRSVRCAQRWEKSLALPVHRIRHLEGYTVYAYPVELETWRRSRECTGLGTAEPVAPSPAGLSNAARFRLWRLFLRAMPLRAGRS